jgi:hypothetical protein
VLPRQPDVRFRLPQNTATGHPGRSFGLVFPVSALEMQGPWHLRAGDRARIRDILVPDHVAAVEEVGLSLSRTGLACRARALPAHSTGRCGQAIRLGEASGRRVFVRGDDVANHYAGGGGAIWVGQEVEEPGFPRYFTDRKTGLVYRTQGGSIAHRRLFCEYDFWNGYARGPLVPRANYTMLSVAGTQSARVWGQWLLCEGSHGTLVCLTLLFEVGPGGLRKDARFPYGTFGPFPDYYSPIFRNVVGPCGRHPNGRPVRLAPLSDHNIAVLLIQSGPWDVSDCEIRTAGGVALLAERWCEASFTKCVLGGMGGGKEHFWTKHLPEVRFSRDCRMAADGVVGCDRAEVSLLRCVIEDCGFNAGDAAHFWHSSVGNIEDSEIHHCCYAAGIDDSASLFMLKCTIRDLLFEAFYAGAHAAKAEMRLLDNTIFGEMWWEHEDLLDVCQQNATGQMLLRPGFLVDKGNEILPRLPTMMQQVQSCRKDLLYPIINRESR